MRLSILCVTRAEHYAFHFLAYMHFLARQLQAQLVIVADGDEALACLQGQFNCTLGVVHSQGYIESVLDQALQHCQGDYVLRLDDDEMCSPAMERWLERESYLAAPHWKFPRQHVWPDLGTCLVTPHLWPDHQTRLSVKAMAGGRYAVHAGSPYGGGADAPVSMWHFKFLVKTRDQRLEVAQRYDAFCPGYGTGSMLPFSLPEDAYDVVTLSELGNGEQPWTPAWTRQTHMRDEVVHAW